jgi:hypothetical protein
MDRDLRFFTLLLYALAVILTAGCTGRAHWFMALKFRIPQSEF